MHESEIWTCYSESLCPLSIFIVHWAIKCSSFHQLTYKFSLSGAFVSRLGLPGAGAQSLS